MSSWLGTALFLLLAAINGLLAAAGSALRNSHPTELRSLEEQGIGGAALARRVASSATQLIVSLRLGHGVIRLIAVLIALLALAPVALQLEAIQSRTLALAMVVALSWFVIGTAEFFLENLALRRPIRWALRLAPLVAVVEFLLSPFISVILRLGRTVAHSPYGRRYPLVTEEEIMTLVDAGEEGGIIEGEEKAMIYSIFQLDDTLAREVMVPRIDVLAFEDSTLLEEATRTLLETGYSRAPVYRDSIDDIVGLIYVKDLLAAWQDRNGPSTVGDLSRKAYFVPEAKRVDDLLTEMQSHRIQMAIVVDEYGGTAGLVTFEDIVEEIVGEVRDEYDDAEELPFIQIEDDEYVFDGGIDLDDVNNLVGASLPKETSETLGGYIYGHLGRVPHPGEQLKAGGLNLIVEQVVGRRIRKVRARRIDQPEKDAETESDGNHRGTTR